MSSRAADESEFDGVLNTVGFVFAAEARKSDAVIHLLGVVLVSNIEDDAIFAAVVQKSERRVWRSGFSVKPLMRTTYFAVTSLTRNSAQPLRLQRGVV